VMDFGISPAVFRFQIRKIRIIKMCPGPGVCILLFINIHSFFSGYENSIVEFYKVPVPRYG
jgi:hypothetical protein